MLHNASENIHHVLYTLIMLVTLNSVIKQLVWRKFIAIVEEGTSLQIDEIEFAKHSMTLNRWVQKFVYIIFSTGYNFVSLRLWPVCICLCLIWIAALAISFSRNDKGTGGIRSDTGTIKGMCESGRHENNESESMATVARPRRSGSPSCCSLSPTWRKIGNENNVW